MVIKMNKKIAIITDSCADLSKELQEKYHIFVLPMVIQCEDGEHKEGIDIDVETIYEKQKNELPKTSTPTGNDVLNTLERIKEEGYDKAIALILSSGLSGSYNQFCLLLDDVDGLEVAAYDSKSASIGMGAVVQLLAEYIENQGDNVDFEEAKKFTSRLISDVKVFFAVDTLEFLVKGGRIGRAAGFAGSILDLKPILSFDEDGVIYSPAKVRGQKKVEGKLVSLVQENLEKDSNRKFYLLVADGSAREARNSLEQSLMAACPGCISVLSTTIGATLSAHLGRGVLGAGYIYVD